VVRFGATGESLKGAPFSYRVPDRPTVADDRRYGQKLGSERTHLGGFVRVRRLELVRHPKNDALDQIALGGPPGQVKHVARMMASDIDVEDEGSRRTVHGRSATVASQSPR